MERKSKSIESAKERKYGSPLLEPPPDRLDRPNRSGWPPGQPKLPGQPHPTPPGQPHPQPLGQPHLQPSGQQLPGPNGECKEVDDRRDKNIEQNHWKDGFLKIQTICHKIKNAKTVVLSKIYFKVFQNFSNFHWIYNDFNYKK